MSNPFAPPNSDPVFVLLAATMLVVALTGDGEAIDVIVSVGVAVVAPLLVVDEIRRRRRS